MTHDDVDFSSNRNLLARRIREEERTEEREGKQRRGAVAKEGQGKRRRSKSE